MNAIADEWSDCLRLVDYAHALLWLIYNPNLSSRLSCDCPESESEYEELARSMLYGGQINGRNYRSVLIVPDAPPLPPACVLAPTALTPRSTAKTLAEALDAQLRTVEGQQETEPTTPTQSTLLPPPAPATVKPASPALRCSTDLLPTPIMSLTQYASPRS